MTKEDIPDAQESPDEPSEDELAAAEFELGEPFALGEDCEIMEGHGAPIVTRCGNCEKPFRIQLLAAGYKQCPHCQAQYTHVLLVCGAENITIFRRMLELLSEHAREQAAGESPDRVHVSDGAVGGEDEDEDEDEEGA